MEKLEQIFLKIMEIQTLPDNFENLKIGDIVVFSNTCPHRSDKNHSNTNRRTLYYTYSSGPRGSQYNKYFIDKKNSANKTSKSLEGRV